MGAAGRFGYALVYVLLAAGLSGCVAPQPYVSDERLDRGLVMVLTGTDGRSRINEAICRGLDDGGVDWAIELYDWTVPLAFFQTLRDESRNRRKADEVASRLLRYAMAHPHRPIVLVGQSGGGGFAPWVLEALYGDQRIKGAILLGPPLSPRYPLDEALRHTREGIVSFYSQRDWFLLGVGTIVSGTMDGKHTPSAGKVGFAVPQEPRRAELYGRLYQVPWQAHMAGAGHSGGHLSIGSGSFVADYVAPFVLAPRWDEALRQRVLSGEGGTP